jgi:hypothetical protein
VTNLISSGTVTIFLGNGSGGFAQAAGSPVAVGGFPKGVTSGDFNLDGKPDLAVANQSSSNLTILLGMEVVVLLPHQVHRWLPVPIQIG